MTENWYIVLELEFDPPVEDEKLIAERIEEKKKYWLRHFSDYKDGAKFRSLYDRTAEIEKDMIGPANIRKELAAKARADVYGDVDEMIKMIGKAKGFITEIEAEKLAKEEKQTVEIVERRAKALGIRFVSAKRYQATYDDYYKKKPKGTDNFEIMQGSLEAFHVDNLYEFLALHNASNKLPTTPCEMLHSIATEQKKKIYFKHNNESGTGSKLCGQCELIFQDEQSKKGYDEYLEYQKRKKILDEVRKVAKICNGIFQEEWREFLGKLTEVVGGQAQAEKILIAFCEIEQISYNKANEGRQKSKNIIVCRCGCINDISDGRKVCSNCGRDLVIKCPQCGTMNDVNVRFCKCGFDLDNIEKALAMCDQAEIALDALDLKAAEANLRDAARYWSKCPKIAKLETRHAELKKRIGKETAGLQAAIQKRCYMEARKLYADIRKLFPAYSDQELETSINEKISQAESLFNLTKTAKQKSDLLALCARIYDICADYPGVAAMMPSPDKLTGLDVRASACRKSNLITWTPVNDKSIRYVVVRSSTGWVRHVTEGTEIYRGITPSYEDHDIEAATPYYYNVFAERCGAYSDGATGNIKEVRNFFEIEKVKAKAGDACVLISWAKLPKNATVKIFQITENGSEKLAASTKSSSHTVSNLKNGASYRFRVALSYDSGVGEKITNGVTVEGTPDEPPVPIDTLHVRQADKNLFEATWAQYHNEDVRIYGSTTRPSYNMGDVVPLETLNKEMQLLQRLPLSVKTLRGLDQGVTGVGFRYNGSKPLYVLAVKIKTDTGIISNSAIAWKGEAPKITGVHLVNGKIQISLTPPDKATGFVLLYRDDRFATGFGDRNAQSQFISIKQYQSQNAIVLDTPKDQKYYFSVFAEFRMNGEKKYSCGTDYLFDNRPKVKITYSISVTKKFLGNSFVTLVFESDQREFDLPDIDIMFEVGNTPMFKASAGLLSTVEAQHVKGSATVRIPLPKSLPKDTYIKAFFRDEAAQMENQLCLKLKSDYKIS